MVFVILIMVSYSFGMAYGFGYMGLSYVIPGYALTISSLVAMFFTFFKTNGVLFATRDYDMLMALPIKPGTIITAKFLSMYLNNLAFTMVVMIPMGVGYALWNALTAAGVISWALVTLFAPLFPMTLAAVIAAIIAAVGSGFRHKIFVQMFLSVALIAAIFCGNFWLQSNASKGEEKLILMLTDIGKMISDALHRFYPPSAWFDNSVNNNNLLELMVFLLVSVAVFGVFVTVCAKYYGKINSALKSHHSSSNYKVGRLKSNSIIMAIVKKEAKKFTSSTPYMLNVGVGLILALVLACASLFVGMDKIIDGMDVAGIEKFKPMIAYYMPFFIALLVNMCNTCSVSLSLEGRSLWIVKSLPISRKVLLQGKILFNVLLALPVSLICSIIFIIEFRVNILLGVIYIVFSIVSVLFSSIYGMCLNLKFPNYKWDNETQVIKQGMATMFAVFGSMIGYFALAAAVYGLNMFVAAETALFIISGVMLAVTVIMYKLSISKHTEAL